MATGLYVHVPFCLSRCTYCDFPREDYREEAADGYLRALEVELRGLPEGVLPETIYVGGGTPSALGERQLSRLLALLRPFCSPGGELTVELNPRSATAGKVRILQRAGVSRVSLGVQSFRDAALELLGRRHRARDALGAYDLIRSAFPSVGIDLIAGVPGTTVAEWEEEIRRAVSLRPEHVSVYSLTYEEGADLAERVRSGDVVPIDEETERELFLRTIRGLRAAGYEHYEVSSFCRPGHRSRHNESYWRGSDYVGVGPGACSTLGDRRWTNTADVGAYVRGLLETGGAPRTEERLSARDLLNELILLRLRTVEGIPLSEFQRRAGRSLLDARREKLEPLLDRGLVEWAEGSLRLTAEGLCVADGVILELLA